MNIYTVETLGPSPTPLQEFNSYGEAILWGITETDQFFIMGPDVNEIWFQIGPDAWMQE